MHYSGKLGEGFPTILSSEILRSLNYYPFRIGPQDSALLRQAGAGSLEGYLYGGFTVAVGIRALFQLVGGGRVQFRNILDFGCGSGRVIRWLADPDQKPHLYGIDINNSAIAWCASNIPYAEFAVGAASPPLPYANQQFDVIIGVSVFSHLDQQLERAWLTELHRIARPGALLLLSVHGENKAQRDLKGDELEQFMRRGHLYKRAIANGAVEGLPDGSVKGLPDFYQVSYHSRAYVTHEWGEYFGVLGFLEHGPLYYQDMVLLQKQSMEQKQNGHTQPWLLKLPIAVIETLAAGAKVNNDALDIGGWAFSPDGRAVEVAIWFDDQEVARCIANRPRPDVAQAFPTNRSAAVSGFATAISLRNLKKGPHIAWLSLAGDVFPVCATFFSRDSYVVRVARRFGKKMVSRLLGTS
jgi:SAM-dependent methyltransferase